MVSAIIFRHIRSLDGLLLGHQNHMRQELSPPQWPLTSTAHDPILLKFATGSQILSSLPIIDLTSQSPTFKAFTSFVHWSWLKNWRQLMAQQLPTAHQCRWRIPHTLFSSTVLHIMDILNKYWNILPLFIIIIIRVPRLSTHWRLQFSKSRLFCWCPKLLPTHLYLVHVMS